MIPVAVDFETYYDKLYDLKTFGPDAYCSHDSFDPYMVSVAWRNGEELTTDVFDPRTRLAWSDVPADLWLSHNARFDETVHMELLKRGWTTKPLPKAWHCTADLCVWLGAGRSLQSAAKSLLGQEISKDIRGGMKGKSYEQLSIAQRHDLIAYAASDARLCLELWEKYSDQWPEPERKLSVRNRAWGRRGVRIDAERLEAGIQTLLVRRWEAGKLIPWEWDEGKTPLRKKMLALECRMAKIPCPKKLAMDDEECAEWEAKYGDRYPWVGAMRDWRRCNMLVKRLETVKARLRPDGILPYSTKYFGGHTGRFSGDGGFNIQNLPKGELLGVDFRRLIVPREGHKFLAMDLAQIEARITLWLSRDSEALDQVAKGLNLYEVHAIRTMGYDNSRGPLKKTDPSVYQLAKARVLGLGFGCGPDRFRHLAKMQYGIDMSPTEAIDAVSAFRQQNPRIVALWREFQQGLISSSGEDYEVELPSGRMMTYRKVSTFEETSAEIVREERRVKLYGGKIMENIVQATARDLFCEAMMRLDDAGYDIAFHVHDEVVMEVPETWGKREMAEAMDLFARSPDWMKTLPVEAEGFYWDWYQK